MIYQGKAQYPVTEVMLHCAAIPTGFFNGHSAFYVWSTVNRWHVERGFKGFGYHALVMPDGATMAGRPLSMIGAGCIGHNQGVLHLLMVESRKIDQMGDFHDWFTEAQRLAVTAWIAARPGIEKVSGHNDYAPKLCPGFMVKSGDWLN